MDAFGCKIDVQLDSSSPDDFRCIVSKDGVTRGPFLTVNAGLLAARDWSTIQPPSITTETEPNKTPDQEDRGSTK